VSLNDLFVPFERVDTAAVSSICVRHDGGYFVALYDAAGKTLCCLSDDGVPDFMRWMDGQLASGDFVDGGSLPTEPVRFYDRAPAPSQPNRGEGGR
jgi:hypothetical protein